MDDMHVPVHTFHGVACGVLLRIRKTPGDPLKVTSSIVTRDYLTTPHTGATYEPTADVSHLQTLVFRHLQHSKPASLARYTFVPNTS